MDRAGNVNLDRMCLSYRELIIPPSRVVSLNSGRWATFRSGLRNRDFLRIAVFGHEGVDTSGGGGQWLCVKLAGAVQSIKYFSTNGLRKILACTGPNAQSKNCPFATESCGKVPQSPGFLEKLGL
jgi:hypothetical protein